VFSGLSDISGQKWTKWTIVDEVDISGQKWTMWTEYNLNVNQLKSRSDNLWRSGCKPTVEYFPKTLSVVATTQLRYSDKKPGLLS
jgi:hypothetical protein